MPFNKGLLELLQSLIFVGAIIKLSIDILKNMCYNQGKEVCYGNAGREKDEKATVTCFFNADNMRGGLYQCGT